MTPVSSRRRSASRARLQRFRITEFRNPKTGSISFRVTGSNRDGCRIRENFSDLDRARIRQSELEQGFQGRKGFETVQITSLSRERIAFAEAAFLRLDDDRDLLLAVDHWLRHGKASTPSGPAIRLDEAERKFVEWLDATPTIRPTTKRNLRLKVQAFVHATGNVQVPELSADTIEHYLESRKVTPRTRKNDHLAISRFCAWMAERPRRWLNHNPAREVKVEVGDNSEPEVYSIPQVMRLLVAAKRFRGGRFLPFVVLQLFCGLRPEEAIRVPRTSWNLRDGEIRLNGEQTKTGRSRTVKLEAVAVAWLKVCGEVKNPLFDRRAWMQLRQRARIIRWIHDGLRHAAISHHFRLGGSYGFTAEWAGNSEAIIREHYQGRVSTADAHRFWRLFPSRAERRAVAAGPENVVEMLRAA